VRRHAAGTTWEAIAALSVLVGSVTWFGFELGKGSAGESARAMEQSEQRADLREMRKALNDCRRHE